MKRVRCGFLLVWVFLLSSVLVVAHAQTLVPTPGHPSVPEPVPMIEHPDDIVTFLLLGSDTSNPVNAGRTDVILIVAVSLTGNTVSLLSIPRDLYVYIPGRSMQRINAAYGFGRSDNIDNGVSLLIETLRYNLGLDVDYYARVDFNGFRQIIDAVGGVEVAVDCAIEDWRLKETGLDPTDENNWVKFTLPVGVHRMDGDLALWYVRSRRTSSDFDRGRRQQVVMRALWHSLRELGLLDQVTDVWPQMLDIVETDVPLEKVLQLLPLATTLTSDHIASYTFRLNHEVTNWRSPEGSSVLLTVPEAVAALIDDFLRSPTASQSQVLHRTVFIENASGNSDMPRVAADRLAWEGFTVSFDDELLPSRKFTVIYDYTGQTKEKHLDVLRSVFGVSNESIKIEPDPDRAFDYKVTLGQAYYPCTYDVLPPSPS